VRWNKDVDMPRGGRGGVGRHHSTRREHLTVFRQLHGRFGRLRVGAGSFAAAVARARIWLRKTPAASVLVIDV